MTDKEKDLNPDATVQEAADTAAEAGATSQGTAETATDTTAGTVEDGEEVVAEDAEEEIPEGVDPKTWAEKRAAKKQAKQDKKDKDKIYKEQIEQLEDKVKRQLAEFENFRNRTEKEKQAMFETGAKSVIEKILPVIDNFERGFATVEAEDEEDAFVGGMRMVYKQLLTELEKIGVQPIEAVGHEFDPNFHNAVMQVASEEYESGIVAQELIKGYTYRDTVVRHTMVAVAE